MSEQPAGEESLPYGVPACRDAWDSVDHVLAGWARERPDLDFTPVGVVTRLARVRGYLDAAVAAVFARFGLTAADFLVIVTLRRSGAPYRMPQARLMDALGLTSGTVSVRLDRLERRGIVTRTQGPAGARGSMVQLTGQGLALFDQVAPVHLANEDRLLAALTGEERLALAGLLRCLLASFETHTSDVADRLGLTLEPAHLAQQRRRAVGLTHRPGMLVAAVRPGSPSAEAGVEHGDLLTHLDGEPVISSTGLALLLDGLTGEDVIATVVRGNDEATLRIRLPGPEPAPDVTRARPTRRAPGDGPGHRPGCPGDR